MEITIDNKKMWESILKELWHYPLNSWLVECIKAALKDQGLKYNTYTNKIDGIEPEPEYYKCIKEYKGFTIGKVYKTNENGDLPSDPENPFVIWIENPYFKEWFRPATPEEIPYEPKQEWCEDTQQWIDTIIKDYEEWYEADINHRATIQARINTLKSLRPQSHWNPSDEQMEYLAKAILTLGNEGDCKTASILNELRTDLKKL